MDGRIERNVKPRVLEALDDTRIVVIQGARQVGKTTLVRDIVDRLGGRLVTFDDEITLANAKADPVGFLLQHPDGLLAIDEIQRAPEMILALKLVVDRDPRPGRYLITGSADLLRLPAAEDSLAGRTERIEMHGFSQGELAGHRETFLDRLFAGDLFLGHESSLTRHDYLERATAGSYPEALARTPGRRRREWLDSYLAQIVQRDAPEISDIRRLGELPLVLRILAARNSEELNVADIAKETGIPASSLNRILELLEILYLIQRTPAWSTNLTKRAVSRPKASLLDTGLAARLVGVSATGANPDAYGQVAGHLLEGFVAGELRRQRAWADETIQISHFRDRAGAEVDLILETPDGRIAAIEVKATSRVHRTDNRWLSQLRDKLGTRFTGGLILHTGITAGPFGDRIAAIPIETIWTT
ncbi:MAG: ATP-binding protein [Nocardioides sp.]|uniref:ATP-binding protein n=1 Tax=Nocardioides sp. TaxID=35761 RepID=UPI0039E56651